MLIKEILKNIPAKPGVYIFKDKNGQALYIGKANNLKNRIRQYFQINSLKVKKIINLSHALEFIETKSEVEAIFKESDLIKKINPPFNQLLRDDSKYFYLIFTNEKIPKITVSHQPEKFASRTIIGPFADGSSLRIILKIIRKNLPFCTCLEKHLRNCLNSQLDLCYGWCCLKNSILTKDKIETYNQSINLIKKIFKSDLTNLKRELLNKMKKLINEEKIEEAQKIRSAFVAIEKIESHQNLIKSDSFLLEHQQKRILVKLKKIFGLKKIPRLIEVCDISHLSGKEKVGVLVSFLDGTYQSHLVKKFRIKTVLKPDDPRMIYEVISRRVKHKEWGLPDLFLIDGGKPQYQFAEKAILEYNLNIDILALAKPKEIVYYRKNKSLALKTYPEIKDFLKILDRKAHQVALKYHQQIRGKI